MNISNEELKEVKEKIFNENITQEEKENIDKKINEEIEKILKSFEEESDPIDE